MQDLIELVSGVKTRRADRQNESVAFTQKEVLEDKSIAESLPTVSCFDLPKPFLDDWGNLVIPFSSEAKYHWWDIGQSISETRAEIELSIKQESS